MTLFWRSAEKVYTGFGEVVRFDPMVGAARYRAAAGWLASTGRRVGFASFTFDPGSPGSVVFAPEHVVPEEPLVSTPEIPAGRIADDGRAIWDEGFVAGMTAIDDGRVQKVVLARQVDLEFAGPVPIGAVIDRLLAANPDTYVFSIDGLVGASPELLVSVAGDRVTSLVLAGTARSEGALQGVKISEEHRYAADSVAETLSGLTLDLAGEQSVLSFGAINHVGTRFVGRRMPGLGVLDLVAALHPTAALGGTPRTEAMSVIAEIEPRSRGRYGGPVGWFDPDGNGEFSLALRCANIRGNRATLYAGGGLVDGSTPDSEFDETEIKLIPMLNALGVDPGR